MDQADNEDRSHQVAGMADVYRCAERVLMPLEQPFQGHDKAMLSIADNVREHDLEVSLVANKLSLRQDDLPKIQQCLDSRQSGHRTGRAILCQPVVHVLLRSAGKCAK